MENAAPDSRGGNAFNAGVENSSFSLGSISNVFKLLAKLKQFSLAVGVQF